MIFLTTSLMLLGTKAALPSMLLPYSVYICFGFFGNLFSLMYFKATIFFALPVSILITFELSNCVTVCDQMLSTSFLNRKYFQ
jgi:hypothetical protein